MINNLDLVEYYVFFNNNTYSEEQHHLFIFKTQSLVKLLSESNDEKLQYVALLFQEYNRHICLPFGYERIVCTFNKFYYLLSNIDSITEDIFFDILFHQIKGDIDLE